MVARERRQDMASVSFMEKMVDGVFDETAFNSYRMPGDSDKVQSLLQSYREMFKNHSPQKIEEEGRIPGEILQKMRKKGFFGISLAETYGGLGVGIIECIRFVEEISAQDLSSAVVFLAHLFIGIKGIELFGTEKQKRQYLPLAASGEMIFSYALTEPNFGFMTIQGRSLDLPRNARGYENSQLHRRSCFNQGGAQRE
jgi:acyl-CoA dehydrogenase family protein 9